MSGWVGHRNWPLGWNSCIIYTKSQPLFFSFFFYFKVARVSLKVVAWFKAWLWLTPLPSAIKGGQQELRN